MYNLDNYKEQYRDKDQDILDEIRASIFDSVDLTPYLDNNPKQDPYRLQQIRVALKQGINESWLQGFASGDILRRLRHLHQDGVNLDQVSKYIGYRLDESYYIVLLDLLESNVPLPEDFSLNRIPQHLLPVLKSCLQEGFYDDRLFTSGIQEPRNAYALALLLQKSAQAGTEFTVSNEFFKSRFELIQVVLKVMGSYNPKLIQDILDNPSAYDDPYKVHLLEQITSTGLHKVSYEEFSKLPVYQLSMLNTLSNKGIAAPDLYQRGALSYQESKSIHDEALILNFE